MNIVSMCFILFFASVHTSTLHSASFSIFFSWLNNKIARLTFIIHEPTQSNSSEDGFRQKVALSEALLAEVGKINPDVDRTADMINSGESILHWRDRSGYTPLHRVIAPYERRMGGTREIDGNVQEKIIDVLLRAGADVNAKTVNVCHSVNEETALHLATNSDNSISIMRRLIEAGARIDVRDKEGETPLWWALNYTHPQEESRNRARFLVDHGADPTQKRNDGLGLIDFCDTSEKERFLALLIERSRMVRSKTFLLCMNRIDDEWKEATQTNQPLPDNHVWRLPWNVQQHIISYVMLDYDNWKQRMAKYHADFDGK